MIDEKVIRKVMHTANNSIYKIHRSEKASRAIHKIRYLRQRVLASPETNQIQRWTAHFPSIELLQTRRDFLRYSIRSETTFGTWKVFRLRLYTRARAPCGSFPAAKEPPMLVTRERVQLAKIKNRHWEPVHCSRWHAMTSRCVIDDRYGGLPSAVLPIN